MAAVTDKADAIVVGAGLAGLVATAELADAGKRVIVLDQEPEASLGGQAHWSLGGLFFVDSPEQRRARIHDSRELAWQDWLGTAGFDRDEDEWPRRWAEAYVDFAAGEKRPWLAAQGMKWMPSPGWAERGGYDASGPGNSVPRFHLTWGTGPGVLEPFVRRVREAEARGLVTLRFRHRVDELVTSGDAVEGVRGAVLEPSPVARGEPSSREAAGDFELSAAAVLVTSGGIGANHDMVRRNWPSRLGKAPEHMISGVPDSTDGRMLAITEDAGGRIINRGPDVALHGGHPELEPDLEPPRDQDHPGPFVAVVRRHRQAAARAALPRLRHAGDARPHHDHGLRPHLVRADPEDHRARVRPERLGAEPRRDSQGHPPADPLAAAGRGDPAGGGVQEARRGLRGGARPARRSCAA